LQDTHKTPVSPKGCANLNLSYASIFGVNRGQQNSATDSSAALFLIPAFFSF